MIKPIIAAVASVVGVVTVILKKDAEILKLQKRIAHLESYENFSSIFTPAYEGGIREGRHRQRLDSIREKAHLN